MPRLGHPPEDDDPVGAEERHGAHQQDRGGVRAHPHVPGPHRHHALPRRRESAEVSHGQLELSGTALRCKRLLRQWFLTWVRLKTRDSC